MKYLLSQFEFKSIKEMPAEQRPREKMANCGPFYLSDYELVCILLGSGSGTRPVQDVACDILDVIDRNKNRVSLLSELQAINGLGVAKASTIVASLELGRRLETNYKRKYKTPEDIFNYIRHYGDRNQECFFCVQLNGAMEIISYDIVSAGLINRTLADPRSVFASAIQNRATSVVLAHNHPSMDLEFSSEDLELTQRMIQAGRILGIKVVDHIVFSIDGYHSMLEDGVIFFT